MINKYKEYLTETELKGLEFLLTTEFNREELTRLLDDLITDGSGSVVCKQFLWELGRDPNELYKYNLPFKTQREAKYLTTVITWED